MSEKPNFFESVGTEQRQRRGVSASYSGGGGGAVPTLQRDDLARESPFRAAGTTGGVQRWSENQGTFWGAASTHESLPAGLYRCDAVPMIGTVLLKQNIEVDNLLRLPDSHSLPLLEEFERFWTLEPEFRKRGFLHKRGILLYGPPGSGKTSTINLMIEHLVQEREGIVLFVDQPGIAASALQLIRRIEPSRPMIVVLEDLDALTDRHGENEFLALLDGEAQVDGVIFLATTNYPERLDRRFVDRPSRFDTIGFVDMPSAIARRAYLTHKEPSLTDEELREWVELSEDFSVAHLKELIIAVRCFGQTLEAAAERLSEMRTRKPSSSDNRNFAGFTGRLGKIGNGHLEPATTHS